jgi:hypothetical protein
MKITAAARIERRRMFDSTGSSEFSSALNVGPLRQKGFDVAVDSEARYSLGLPSSRSYKPSLEVGFGRTRSSRLTGLGRWRWQKLS